MQDIKDVTLDIKLEVHKFDDGQKLITIAWYIGLAHSTEATIRENKACSPC